MASPALAFLAAQLLPPELPTALGVLRAVDRPCYETGVAEQIQRAASKGPGKLEDLLAAGDTWTVGEPGAPVAPLPS